AVVVLGTAVALFLKRECFGVEVLRSLVLLPWGLPGAISAVRWVGVVNSSWGVINTVLRDLGLIHSEIPWLTQPNLAFFSVTVAHVWTQIPFTVILIMAALSTLN